MVKNGILLSHIGQLSYNTIGILLRQLEQLMKDLHIEEITRKKIYAVMVECLENIDRHKHPELQGLNLDSEFDTHFLLEFIDDSFIIITGNAIINSAIDDLQERLDTVNKLDEKELKKLYRKKLLTGEISEKGGAGVGIIDMAKITQNKIEYSFKPINEELSFYQIKLKIKNSNN